MGRQSPLAAGSETIEDTVDGFTQVGGFGGSAVGKLEQGFQQFPLGVGQVGEVGFSGYGLSHRQILPIWRKSCKSNLPNLPKLRRAL